MTKHILVIDDERTFNFECTYARTIEDATTLLFSGAWDEVWWDHDLGGGINGATTLGLARSLEEIAAREERLLPIGQMVIHTSNPVGREELINCFYGYYKIYVVDALVYSTKADWSVDLGGATQREDEMGKIFVFGSNLAGRHGRGAAAHARAHYGAAYGTGVGRTGQAYAIPTKDGSLNTLSREVIAEHVKRFIDYAWANPDLTFSVTRVGCGLAGYEDKDMAPLFEGVPPNCEMPDEWAPYLNRDLTKSLL